MIAGKKMDGDPAVGDLCQFPQDAGIPFGDNRPVLVPEVKEIAYDENDRRIPPDLLQEFDYSFLPDEAGGMIGCTQMKVREEIDLFSWRDLHARIYDLVTPQRLSTR